MDDRRGYRLDKGQMLAYLNAIRTFACERVVVGVCRGHAPTTTRSQAKVLAINIRSVRRTMRRALSAALSIALALLTLSGCLEQIQSTRTTSGALHNFLLHLEAGELDDARAYFAPAP